MNPMRIDPLRRGLLLAGLSLWLAGRAWAHGVSLDLHHGEAEASAFHAGFLVPWMQKVEQEAGGRVRFHPHAATPFDPASPLYDRVQDGGTDVAWTMLQPTAERFPRLTPFELPLAVRQAQGASRALADYARVNDLLDRDLGDVHVLALHVADGTQLHWGKAFAAPPADLAGHRVAVATAFEGALLTAVGATASVVPPARMGEALAAGSVDGVLLSWERAAALGVDKAARSHTEFGAGGAGLTSGLHVLAMSAGAWRGLADDLKAVFDANGGLESAAWLGRGFDVAAAAARQAAVKRGDAIRVLAKDERDRLRQGMRPVVEARVKAVEQGGVRLGPLLDAAREALQQFDAAK